jgi:hypothetical protein
MQFAGVLPEDAPDPRIETAARLRGLPFPLMTLVPQPTLEDRGAIGFTEGMDAGGRSQLSVSVGYTLWRNPGDRGDPLGTDRCRRAIGPALEGAAPASRASERKVFEVPATRSA